MEEWKIIEGYPNYQVSSEGRVKSLERIDRNNHPVKEKILNSSKDGGGYLMVGLWKDGIRKTQKIHRLVGKAFLPNPDNLPQVNHIDEDKTNNRVENLEYCTAEYNLNYGTHNERVAKSKSIPILQFSKTGEFIRRWESGTQVKRELGFNQSNISMCCKGKLKLAYGFLWKFEKIEEFDIDINRKKVDY